MAEEPERSFYEMEMPFPAPVESPWAGLLNEKQLSRLQLQALAELYKAITERGAIINEHGVFVSVSGEAIQVTVTHGKTIQSKPIDVITSGDNEIVAGVDTKRIKVIAFALQAQGTVAVEWNGLMGAFSFQAREGVSQSIEAPSFLFGTEAGDPLVLNLSGAVNVTGYVTYFADDTQ